MKKFRRVISLALVLFLMLFQPSQIYANDIESIDIEAKLQDNGSVIITDHRVFNAQTGTEHFISIGNLGNSQIIDFKVFENDQQLQDIGEWNVNASFEEKAGKYGINDTGSELELCFGLGSYGRKEFTIQYTITNFIYNLTDGYQMFYWQFINPNMDYTNSINIRVTTANGFKFEYPDTRMWGFGYKGTTSISQDALTMTTNGEFRTTDYMVMLSIMPANTFHTTNSLDRDSESMINQAMEGADLNGMTYEEYRTLQEKPHGIENNYDDYPVDYPDEPQYDSSPGSGFFSFAAPFIGINVGIIGLVIAIMFSVNRNSKPKHKVSESVKSGYYREIPYKGLFLDLEFLIDMPVSNIISAFILKWVEEGALVDDIEIVGIFTSREKLALKINKDSPPKFGSGLEETLWYMVVHAAGDDAILSEKEFNRYIRRNITVFNEWTEDITNRSRKLLAKHEFIKEEKYRVLGIFPSTRYVETPVGQKLIDNISMFKNYLKDFSLLDERPVSNVKLWNEYLIWAAILGISKEVYEQLKIVDPRIDEYMPYNYNTILLTTNFAHAAQLTQSNANSSSGSSFSGGGGSSFGGGGGGSFGGGSGGGTR